MRKWKVNLLALFLVMMLLVSFSGVASADVEPNNTFESAERVGEGTFSGTVTDMDTDYYVITIPAHKMVTIIVTADYGSELDVTLYDQNRSMYDWGYPSDGSSYTFEYDPAGSSEDVYLEIESDNLWNSTDNYTFTVTFSESDLENLLNDLEDAMWGVTMMCIAGIVILVIIVVLIIVVLVRKKNKPPQQPYPPQAYPQAPPQQPQYPPQPPPQGPGDQSPPQGP